MLIVPPARAFPALFRAARSAIFYRFTVEEAIENRDPAYVALDDRARKVSGVEVTLRADHVLGVPRIG